MDAGAPGLTGQEEGEACSIRGFNRVGVGVLRSGPPEEEGRKKSGKDRVCPMAPDVAHVMWPAAGMSAAMAGSAMHLGRISQSLGGAGLEPLRSSGLQTRLDKDMDKDKEPS